MRTIIREANNIQEFGDGVRRRNHCTFDALFALLSADFCPRRDLDARENAALPIAYLLQQIAHRAA
jgi:hypothetical protein